MANRGFSSWRNFNKKPKTTANSLTRAVLTYLNADGWMAWRNNNIPIWDVSAAAKALKGRTLPNDTRAARTALSKFFRRNNVFKGVPDIIGFNKKTGQFIGVEIKVGNDKASSEQMWFLSLLKRSGGISILCKDFDDFLECYKNYTES